jgi:glycerol dehydrogenase-like iron-containing ADH family enzyme
MPADDMPARLSGEERMRELAATIRTAGHVDPVLVVAGDDAISLLAPAWAGSFADARWIHRVLASGGGPAEIASIAAEADSLAAAVIVAVGSPEVIAACRAAAAARGLPFVACPLDAPPAGPPWRSGSRDG